MIEEGEFIDMYEMNNTLYLDYILKSKQILKRKFQALNIYTFEN